MAYANIVLPVPLDAQFSYIVPDALADKVQVGMRVVVPFGKTKTYVGIVSLYPAPEPANSVDEKGKKITFKEILSIFEPTPILVPEQLKLWQWMSNYYMTPIGDVYKAAFPSGLKTEDKYKPRTELYITLSDIYKNNEALNLLLNAFGRAKKQQEVLMTYLQLAGVDTINSLNSDSLLREVTREELLNEAHCSLSVIHALVERKVLRTYEKEVGRLQIGIATHYEKIKPLNEAQTDAYNHLLLQMMQHPVTLLHGVTSSGKTEIYIHLIQKAIEEHKQVLYLVPEIALTVQMTSRLQAVFGDKLGIYHSKYSDAERVEIWKKQLSNHPYDVILGARSAVFLPFQQLGLVIVDEEHEQSFKQQDPAPRYHARSAAIILANMYKAKVLLGTATPSIETYFNAKNGKFGFVELSRRYKDIQLPQVEIVDIKDLRRRKMMKGPFSPRLLSAVREALEHGQQAILFQNRRGFAPMVECKQCGWVPKCPNCDVSLTLHKNMNSLSCHYCGYTYKVPTACPCCEGTDIRGRGYGTEKIEDEISSLLPEAKIARMDLDTTRTHNAYDRIINEFSEGKTNLLIGTQMITKGLDFDKVSVVGILDADSMLNYPDFRAYEQAFMMMCQVSGRAGRKGKQGLVILQTKNQELPIIQQVVHNDYQNFYRNVLEERKDFHYPPFYRLIYVYLKHREENVVESAGYELGSRLREVLGNRVLGPDKPAVARVKTLNIRKIVLKLENGIDMTRAKQVLRQVQAAMSKDKRYGALVVYYDVDPL
ncbi:replication restart helicase PriA [Prevotella bivia]|uniref:Replication restart protein PriA n=1 Tax=Prevotella bivia DSM 20514 TaxID=868129 RepID=I4Z8R9_9BACT|nr:primosomal protein N' [Prevotella bivia]EFB92999.1 primosomal protein N' [Prevotella bivia JCVIHMP010]EIM32611.1 primosomal protein N'' [Prevotella bivia DSM 20514]